jgi:hypothetical protein
MKTQTPGSNRLLALLLFAAPAALAFFGPTAPSTAAKSEHPVRVPSLHVGQKFVYLVHYQTKKVTRSESHIATSLLPEGQDSDAKRWLSVEIKSLATAAGAPGIAMHTQFLPPDGSAPPASATDDSGVVDFALQPDGSAGDLRGFDALSGDEQSLWRQWIAQFALGWTFPAKGVKPGEKWKKVAPVAGAALAHLDWEKQYEYVRNELCPPRSDDSGSSSAKNAGSCAIIVTITTMKQHGPHDDATPDDYKAHQLKTSGTAQGKSQVVTYISLQTGLVVRATESSAQTLDVLIAKKDDSNKAHYNVDATSHAEVVLQ